MTRSGNSCRTLKRKMNYDYLKFFCGRHELMLNNLKSRWYLRDIVNFLDFFKEPWVELLLHDKFEELSTINKVMVTKSAEDVLKENISRDMRLKEMMRKCDERGVTKMIEYTVVDFLRVHRQDFIAQFALHEDFPSNANKNNNY
ncbi:hypothetical protein DOY81_014949 [Sarcophaga bullata]|nr:hypothetical protein DOY81_014949 [Sarcophaga bullata]